MGLYTPENLDAGLRAIIHGLPHAFLPFGIPRDEVSPEQVFTEDALQWADNWLKERDNRPAGAWPVLLKLLPLAARMAAVGVISLLQQRPKSQAFPLPPWLDSDFLADVAAEAESEVTPLC